MKRKAQRKSRRLGYSVFQSEDELKVTAKSVTLKINRDLVRYRADIAELLAQKSFTREYESFSFNYFLEKKILKVDIKYHAGQDELLQAGLILPFLPWKVRDSIMRFMAELEVEVGYL